LDRVNGRKIFRLSEVLKWWVKPPTGKALN
jgi:hypothetical protein